MSELFRRSWKLTVDTIEITDGMDIEFKVLKTEKAHPNQAMITVWNLREDHRAQLLKRNRSSDNKSIVGVPVDLEVGYQDNRFSILSADLREVVSVREGPDWKTTLAGEDGGRSWREARINQTFSQGTSIYQVAKACASAMGIGLGNSNSALVNAKIEGLGGSLQHPITLSGSAAKQLDRVINSIGLIWSIQDGAIQIRKKHTPLETTALKITPTTGLISSPESGIDSTVRAPTIERLDTKKKTARTVKPKNPSLIKFKTLIIPGMIPGRRVELHSESFNGTYYLTEIQYSGQTWSQEWYAECIARAVNS